MSLGGAVKLYNSCLGTRERVWELNCTTQYLVGEGGYEFGWGSYTV